MRPQDVWYGPPTEAPRRRRRRWPWVLLVALLVLVGLAVAADRIVLKLAEQRAATALQQSQQLRSTPSVSFAGFPFLTQLATGRFHQVTVTAHGVDVGRDASLHVATVTVRLDDVTASDSYHQFRAARATADATVDYADLSRTVGVPIRYAGDGRIRTHTTVTVAGRQYTGTITAGIRASSNEGLTFVDPSVHVPGRQLPPEAVHVFESVLAQPTSLAGLPFDVRVDGAAATPAGAVLRLSGSDLTYSRS